MYLLDTNACIRILNNSAPGVVDRYTSESPSTVRLCSVVKAELLYGARKSDSPARVLQALQRFFEPLTSLPFDDASADEYGLIRADLERAGIPIGGNDLLIAAIGRRYDATIITHNVSEFIRVVGLRVEDWEQ